MSFCVSVVLLMRKSRLRYWSLSDDFSPCPTALTLLVRSRGTELTLASFQSLRP